MKKLIALILSLCMLLGMLPAMAETAATETAAEAPAETEKVDMNHLIDKILNDINDAVIRVDAEEAQKAGEKSDATTGNVFTILVKVLNNIAETRAKRGEKNENLDKLLAILNDREATKNMNEKELEALTSLVLLELMAEADERAAKQEGEADAAVSISIANGILKEIYDTCQANETLMAAVKATDSRLFEMLEENNKHMKEYVEKTGSLDVVNITIDEKSYEEFEAEIKKLEDYLKGTEGSKQSALDLLALLHAVMDDIHEAVDGHSHDDAKAVDHYQLVGEMLKDLGEAIEKVQLNDIKEKGGENFNTAGSVYAVLERVLKNIIADEAAKEEEAVKQALEMVGKLDEKEVTEEEAEAVFALLFLGAAQQEQAEEIDPEVDFLRSSHLLRAVYDTMMENEVIKAALEATDSRLPEMLVNTGERLKNYLKENKTLHAVKDVDETPFAAFEAEFAKLRDHIESLPDGTPGKAKALGVLDLLHEYVDDIHEAVDGHAHEDTANKTEAFSTGAAFGMKMDEVIAAIGRTGYEIDAEHTHGSVTFTELEYEHVAVDGKRADEHYLFVGDELVAIQICFEAGITTFDQVKADLAGIYGEAKALDLAVLANGIYAVDDEGKLEGRAEGMIVGDMMVVIEENEKEIEVTYVDLTAAYVLAQ